MNFFFDVGRYFSMLKKVFARPEKHKMYFRQLFHEIDNLGVNSVGIVIVISVYIGGIMTIQFAYSMANPLYPSELIGLGTRDTLILEFSSTMLALIMAGKIGSNITSEIGTMRVTEQIDALKVMGINPANYLILPKITAAMIYNPILIVFSMALGIFGGWVAMMVTGLSSSVVYIEGVRAWYDPFTITYALIKTVVFAFIITSVSGYKGYTVKGGSVEVGKASTQAVVYSSILIIIFDLILTQMLLT